MQTGNVFVISAPSGAGKSSLVTALCKRDNTIKVSISHTTRDMRPGDEHGVHYFFTNKPDFEQMLQKHEFLEHANVYGNLYGTHKNTIQNLVDKGYDIILEIDYQGALQIRKLIDNAILIYIFPPSIDELKNRLNTRATDSITIIENRLNLAKDDMSYARHYDFGVINDDFNQALNDLYSIILAHRLKITKIIEKLDF